MSSAAARGLVISLVTTPPNRAESLATYKHPKARVLSGRQKDNRRMTDTRINARPASRWMGLLGAALVVAPAVAHAQPLDLFYERTVMEAADSRCGLFTPQLARALASAAEQARGAALRAGASREDVARAERVARLRAAEADCRGQDVMLAANRVKQAFTGFARINRLTYHGDVAAWAADRYVTPTNPWRLKQEAAFGADRLMFGLAGGEAAPVLLAVAQFADGATPYGARLVLRDTRRSSGPYLRRATGGPTAGLSLPERMPPSGALTGILAEARSEAARDLLPKPQQGGQDDGWAFRFPPQAAGALAGLDPREAVAVDFLFPGDRVRRAYVEVGDFAAGQAFVKLASR
jgi:hypothetical protein